jgi:uncharacterized protein YggU (UPF0235/DUF167 family)
VAGGQPGIRISIRVKPGAKRAHVGGRHGDALVVAVTAGAVEGQATAAALRAVADAFDRPASAASLVTGATSRDKVVALAGEPDALRQRLAVLLDA